ncbi:UNVERIFIED_CONTAM: hypothetical protein GTU68_041981 [Idotea baltica]|nr:hypothetical protein [Idotea baltica]
MTKKFAVFGNPIKQSKSPQIHQQFAAQFFLDISYERQEVAVDGFDHAAQEFFSADGKGLNVTTPFKDDAYQFANRLTPRARRAAAVNTLAVQDNGEILGDTTDGVGLVSDIRNNLNWQIQGKQVLVLGAGGAVRGVLETLLAESPEKLVIANRTAFKAEALAKGFADLGKVVGMGFEELGDTSFDLIINGTSTSLMGEELTLPNGIFAEGCCCYDMAYAPEPTSFLKRVEPHCSNSADGLGMLVGQAAESFFVWTGRRPDTAPVIQNIRKLIRG